MKGLNRLGLSLVLYATFGRIILVDTDSDLLSVFVPILLTVGMALLVFDWGKEGE